MIKKGHLFIVSAPSGAGKTTLLKRLISEDDGFKLAVSHTTRSPRDGEVDGKDYNFTDRTEFERMTEAGDFVEWAEVHGNYYGTSLRMLEEMMASGTDVLHDIDVQGARQIKDSGIEAVFVFILPPSLAELESRLRGRESDSDEVIERRLKNALSEVESYFMYDYVILNDDLDTAFEDMKAVLRASRFRIGGVDNNWINKNFLNL